MFHVNFLGISVKKYIVEIKYIENKINIHCVRLVDSGLLLAAAVLLAALLGCCSKLLAAAAEQKIPHQPNTVEQGSSSEQLSDERI